MGAIPGSDHSRFEYNAECLCQSAFPCGANLLGKMPVAHVWGGLDPLRDTTCGCAVGLAHKSSLHFSAIPRRELYSAHLVGAYLWEIAAADPRPISRTSGDASSCWCGVRR